MSTDLTQTGKVFYLSAQATKDWGARDAFVISINEEEARKHMKDMTGDDIWLKHNRTLCDPLDMSKTRMITMEETPTRRDYTYLGGK